jgi:hypothetical protein
MGIGWQSFRVIVHLMSSRLVSFAISDHRIIGESVAVVSVVSGTNQKPLIGHQLPFLVIIDRHPRTYRRVRFIRCL